ncbi:S-layer homology domain-containing protein [Alteribacillus persepolensis]|uniref:S-layer homology domain-containing protein n=1 Tax=Alteribacillus persepolensis TaxID=568899 RepID=A0A1G8J1P9_9BACI|nr:S-layer homology domain-containing protein [Alteribacillus persepolensis]SDI25169.1 S-layer homology domain-containing protein [Alteribacillus persepolensis]
MRKAAGAFTLAAAFLIGPPAVSSASFPDVPKDFWAKTEIDELSNRGIMGGYPDGTFKPNNPVLRIQAASMIVNELGLEQQDDKMSEFNDVSNRFDQKEIVDIMEETGIMRGSNGNFRPYEPVTRAQMATILTRAYNLKKNEDLYFYDIQPDYWNFSDISALAESGITGGRDYNRIFSPSDATTRAQFVTFLHRATNESEGREPVKPKAGDYGQYVKYEGLLYGIKDPKTIHAVRENEKGKYEEVEIYHLEDSEMYKEADEKEREEMKFNENLQIYGLWNETLGELGYPDLPKEKLVAGSVNTGKEDKGFHLINSKIQKGHGSPHYRYLADWIYIDDQSKLVQYWEEHEFGTFDIDTGVSKADYAGSVIIYEKDNKIKSHNRSDWHYGQESQNGMSELISTVYSGEIIDFKVFEGHVIIVTPDGYTVTSLSGRTLDEKSYNSPSKLRNHGVIFEETPEAMKMMLGNGEETIGVLQR